MQDGVVYGQATYHEHALLAFNLGVLDVVRRRKQPFPGKITPNGFAFAWSNDLYPSAPFSFDGIRSLECTQHESLRHVQNEDETQKPAWLPSHAQLRVRPRTQEVE